MLLKGFAGPGGGKDPEHGFPKGRRRREFPGRHFRARGQQPGREAPVGQVLGGTELFFCRTVSLGDGRNEVQACQAAHKFIHVTILTGDDPDCKTGPSRP